MFFLWKIFKNLNKKKKNLPDERYFELKYNINLLKAVSAILIFLIGFLGFNTYNNISENLNQDFTEKVKSQNEKIDSLIDLVSGYEESIKSLKVKEGESVKNLSEINQQFRIINEKLRNNQEALKYTTKVYVINNLKFPTEIFYTTTKEGFLTIYFKDLKTINNENLPVFKSKPMVVLQGKSIQLDATEITKEYIKIGSSMTYGGYVEENPEFYYFDMWIAEPN